MRVAMMAAPRSWLFLLVFLTVVFKLVLSAVFPVTGDEAYFIHWGVEPALGYYDHPPMIGWWLALLTRISDAPWVLRLPATLLPAIMALSLYGVLRRFDEYKAAMAATGLLLVPIHVWNIFVTTDAPLVLFSFLSGLAYWRASRDEESSAGWYALTGAFLGLAFLSKYFAALLGMAYLAHVLISRRRDWAGLAIIYAAALPSVALNLYWNYEHCWNNLMFNLYNRHEDAGWSWRSPALYALTLLYVLPAPALYALWKGGRWRGVSSNPTMLPFAVIAGFPLLLFAALSLVRQVGLHWLLSFVPFFFAACALMLERRELRRTAIFAGVFSLLHIVAIGVAASLPLERWQGNRLYDGIVFHFRIVEVLKEIQKHEGEYEIAADGYSAAVTLSYYRGAYVFVFGEASSHARHDDIATDFRALAGKNILILRKTPPRDEDYRPYFASVEYRSFSIAGADFHMVMGRQFDYARYHDSVLALVRERYYRIPAYLPQGGCEFCARYFESACPVRG